MNVLQHFPDWIIDLSPALNDNQAYAGKELELAVPGAGGWMGSINLSALHLSNGDK